MIEQFFVCPYCATEVSILIDPSVKVQEFIEDCERCCRPIQFEIEISHSEVVRFDYRFVEQ